VPDLTDPDIAMTEKKNADKINYTVEKIMGIVWQDTK